MTECLRKQNELVTRERADRSFEARVADLPCPTATQPARTAKTLRHGTYRGIDPEETAARVLALREPLGITRVANLTGLDRIGIPVVAVCRPNARSLAVSQGKGLTLAAARASGLMEAAELYHAEHVALPRVRASYAALCRRRPVVDVRGLPRPRTSLFRPDFEIPWIEGRILRAAEPVWVPYELVHVDYRARRQPGSGCFVGGSNGLASGNTVVEALVHGLCEVVERDATTLWFQRSPIEAGGTRIALETVDDPQCRDLLERYAAAGITVGLWETTTDTRIPSFLCQIAELGQARLRPLSGAHGMGCHPQRFVALLRALTEAAQCRLTWISGARDDARSEDFDATDEALALERETLEMPGSGRDFRDGPDFFGPTFEDDLTWLLDRLEAAGAGDALWVDLSCPELGIPVVRVIVPGLEPPGFGAALATYRPGLRARRRPAWCGAAAGSS